MSCFHNAWSVLSEILVRSCWNGSWPNSPLLVPVPVTVRMDCDPIRIRLHNGRFPQLIVGSQGTGRLVCQIPTQGETESVRRVLCRRGCVKVCVCGMTCDRRRRACICAHHCFVSYGLLLLCLCLYVGGNAAVCLFVGFALYTGVIDRVPIGKTFLMDEIQKYKVDVIQNGNAIESSQNLGQGQVYG